jgi:hypothetical protein
MRLTAGVIRPSFTQAVMIAKAAVAELCRQQRFSCSQSRRAADLKRGKRQSGVLIPVYILLRTAIGWYSENISVCM